MRHIYLDYNATTPISPSVQEAMLPFLAEHYGNPSSPHALGRACQEAMEDARRQVAALIGAEQEEIIFTSGGTEANNLAIKGVMMRHWPNAGGHMVISSIEHPAVSEPAKYLERIGFDVTIVGCDANGIIHPDIVEAAIRPDTKLVSIMMANNEIGTIQPIKSIAEICRRRNVLVHTDAAQAVGKIPALVDQLNVDLLSIAGHKMYAPKGVGALFVRKGIALEPAIHGAGHEHGMRPGTENVPYIVGLGHAARIARKSIEDALDRLALLRDRLYDHLKRDIGEALSVNGGLAERLPNTLSVNFPGVTAQTMLQRIPELCASTGSACHSNAQNMSVTLASIGLSPTTANGTVRLSVGWYTSEDEVDRAANLLVNAWEDLR